MPKTKKPSETEPVVVEPEDTDSLQGGETTAVADPVVVAGDESAAASGIEADDNGAEATPSGASPASDAVPIRKTLGAKEVIPFAWKVIGLSGDMILTLFKSIEREDADTQLDRLEKDGTYKDLQVVVLNHKIVQPKSVKDDFVARAFREKKETPEAKGLAKKTSSKKKAVSGVVANKKKSAKKTVQKPAKKTVKKTAKAKKAVATKAAKKKVTKKLAAKSGAAAKKSAKTVAKRPTKKSAAKPALRKAKTAKKKK